MSLKIFPITLTGTRMFVQNHHRHHRPPPSGLFAIAAGLNGALVGVLIVGRPVSRYMDDHLTAEVTRCATDGTKNACSLLYGAAWRTARELGYRRMITYTLPVEGGASLRASGWASTPQPSGGRKWSGRSGASSRGRGSRANDHPCVDKTRWEVSTSDYEEAKAAKPDTRGIALDTSAQISLFDGPS